MTTCRFCDHRNSPTAARCASCGAELSVTSNRASEEPAAAAPAPIAGWEQEVLEVLQQEGKLSAIKHYRDTTGSGLREAKEAVEGLAARAGIPSGGRSGCATMVAALLATGCLAGAALAAGAGRWPW